MSSATSSPVFRALEKVAALLLPPSGKFEVFSYFESFDYLWTLDRRFLDRLDDEKPIILILWDSVPRDSRFEGIPVEQQVTPIDWAVAASLKSLSLDSVDGYPQLDRDVEWKVLIVDAAGESDSRQARHMLLSRLQSGPERLIPWLSLTPPQYVFARLASAALSEKATPKGTSALQVVKGLWTSSLTSPGPESIRHSISNIVGPLVLLSSIVGSSASGSNGSSTNRALEMLLQSCGMLPDIAELPPGPWVPRGRWHSETIRRFVLLDDMEELGWTAFLKAALDLRDDELCSYGKDQIKAFLKEQPFALDGTVLFLDLRLFARSSWTQEAEFLSALVDYAEKNLATDRTYPWPKFEEHELSVVRECARRNQRVEDSAYHLALTFFPRLISHLEPHLPIVVFSSTGRREIVDTLRPYGNVILDFDKPRFFGDSGVTVLADSRRKFSRALDSAISLARARHFCRSVVNRNRAISVNSGQPHTADGHGVVEIYIDESGSESADTFVVGGVILRFPNLLQVDELDKKLRAEGLMWGLARDFPPDNSLPGIPTNYLTKRGPARPGASNFAAKNRAYYAEHLNKLDQILEQLGVSRAAFGLLRNCHRNWIRTPGPTLRTLSAWITCTALFWRRYWRSCYVTSCPNGGSRIRSGLILPRRRAPKKIPRNRPGSQMTTAVSFIVLSTTRP